jgi:hypothetical protein
MFFLRHPISLIPGPEGWGYHSSPIPRYTDTYGWF